jgi:hypothetical protein
MADQSDVENALVALVASALYPNGTSALATNGTLSRVYRGWPEAAALDADLAAGWVNVSVFAESGGRNTTRHLDEWLVPAPVAPTLLGSAVGDAVTFSGNANSGQLAGILVDGKTYVHSTESSETPALVAADLAAAIREDRIVLLSGATIVIPGAALLRVRVVAGQPAVMQTRRQEQSFRITCWCPDPFTRDATGNVVDSALAQVKFIMLSDRSRGRLLYRGCAVLDHAEDASLYRRDLVYQVEYPTTITTLLPTMLFADIALGTANQVDVDVIG